jgi:uncharacterized protein (DUF1800 family)
MLKPIEPARWDFACAAHLINRAGFGGTPKEIEELVSVGPEQAVSRLLHFEKTPDPTPDPPWARPDPERFGKLAAIRQASEPERRELQKQEQQLQRGRMLELRGWWLQRMVQGSRPLQEKLTLFWHGHFATSVAKVRDAYYIWRQNELFRRLAAGNWMQMLVEVAKDPAMLIWLDQAQSRKENPNENFAREVMELFALGEGHYSEQDVAEAARALTGWSLDRASQRFVNRARAHDQGIKTVLGRTGNFYGEDVIEIVASHPQSAMFITEKLWSFLAGEAPSPDINSVLAREFRRAGNEFKPLLQKIFLSQEFYAPSLIRSQVKSPVQWLVGTARMLECELPPPSVSVNLLRSLGQDLFAPPNVKGWDGGLAWINTNTLLTRYNEAATLVGEDSALDAARVGRNAARKSKIGNQLQKMRAGGVNVMKILTENERSNKKMLADALEKRLLQSRLTGKQRVSLEDYLDSKGELDESEIRGAIRLIMSTPEYQLS